MQRKKGKGPTKAQPKQQAALKLAQALGTSAVLRPEQPAGGVVEDEPPQIWKLEGKFGTAGACTKAVKDLSEQVETTASGLEPAKTMLADLQEFARHEALASLPTTAEELAKADKQLETVEISVGQVKAAMLAIRKTLAGVEATQPKKGSDQKARMRAKLEASNDLNARGLKAIEEQRAQLAALGKQVTEGAASLETLHKSWAGIVQGHEDKQKQQQALAAAKATYEAKMLEFKGFDTADLAKQALPLKLTVPDFDGLRGTAEASAGKESWGRASVEATNLVRAAERLGRVIKQTGELKKDFDEIKKQTTGRLKKLESDLSGAKVHDTETVAAMRIMLTDSNQAATLGHWSEASEHLQDFHDAADEAEKLVALFEDYSAGVEPKLLTGTILAAFKTLPDDSDNDAALAKLKTVYATQCKVARDDWLTYLGIAGDTVKVGSKSDHYTTFNNSVPVGTDVSVISQDVNKICKALFEVATLPMRIHATLVVGLDRHHRYWNPGAPSYSVSVPTPNPHAALDARYDQMVRDMQTKVREVMKKHGRIGKH